MNSQMRNSDFADDMTDTICHKIRRHVDSDKLTNDEIRKVELTIASQLVNGKRGEYRRMELS